MTAIDPLDTFLTHPDRHPDLQPAATTVRGGRPDTLVELFATTVRQHPRRLAIDTDDAAITYADADARVERLAARLRSCGIGPGDRVGVRVRSGTAELYLAILAVLRSGAAYVPVDADDPDARAEAVWHDAAVSAVIGDGDGDDAGVDIVAHHDPLRCPDELTGAHDAWIIFTSGSTGRPKGVAVPHSAACAFVRAEAALFPVHPGDRVLAGLSVGFDASCEEMWLAWGSGATLVPAPRSVVRSGHELGPWLSARRVTVVSTVPTLAAMWDAADLAGVRLLILGGEACSDELGWRLAAGREAWNTYGPTEATVVSTAARIRPGHRVTIGSALDGWQVAVLDDDGLPVPDGIPGQLVIAGVGLGHYIDPVLDEARYAGVEALGWARAYRSGDVVRATADGLEFVGRTDDQVKIGGRRIELAEVSAQLGRVAGVRAATVVTRRTDAGHTVLVGYAVTDRPAAEIRDELSAVLPDGIVPLVAVLDALPLNSAGKTDKKALPWPLPVDTGVGDELSPTEAQLAALWQRYLGVLPTRHDHDFFALGGASLAAAKLASDLRLTYPAVAVADIYRHRTLRALAARLDEIVPAGERVTRGPAVRSRGGWQLAGLLGLVALQAPSWVLTVLGYDDWAGNHAFPMVGWLWLIAGYLLLLSPMGRVGLVALARRTLLHGVEPGRYPRRSWTGARVWFVDRLGDVFDIGAFGGTPMAGFVARVVGFDVGPGAALGVIPSAASLVRIGSGATVEADADVHGWIIEGGELVLGAPIVGVGARIGGRSLLGPDSSVGDYAEIEAGSLVGGHVPAGERWSGSPAKRVGRAGSDWPESAAPTASRGLKLAFTLTSSALGLIPLLTSLPAIVLLSVVDGSGASFTANWLDLLLWSPVLAGSFVVLDALVVAGLARLLGRWIVPGWHGAGRTSWALWTSGQLLAGARGRLFPLYSSTVTRTWLRLMGVRVGAGSVVSTAVGLGPLVTVGSNDFIADDVVFNGVRAHRGWLELSASQLGDGVFVGNGALIDGGTVLGDGSLVGVQTTPPCDVPGDTSWFGFPALEFPRTADVVDPSRTTNPPRRLRLARGLMDCVRILLPTSVATLLGFGIFQGLEQVGYDTHSLALTVLAAPVLVVLAGLAATLVTIAIKWMLVGRYRAGEHPYYSFFVWRDEIVNSCQELLSGAFLFDLALGTPLMTGYLRAMGTRVGRDTWVDTLTISEFDVVSLGDGCAVNRRSCIESHLFHDRLMRIGSIDVGAGVTVGASTAVLFDTVLGENATIAGRSVVLRGETIPANTSWHGAPVVSQ